MITTDFLEPLYLTEDYRGNKKGTKGYFAGYTLDSGYHCIAMILDDEIIMSKHKDPYSGNINFDEFKNFVQTCIDFDNLHYNYNVILPDPKIALSKKEVESKINDINSRISSLEKEKQFFEDFISFDLKK